FRLNAAMHIEKLRTKLLPWVQATFPNQEVVLQHDGAPIHTAKSTHNFSSESIPFWGKK
ncbi:Uncharacterized protein FKW44_008498, partial [Caligus rogercresseyi]